MEPLGWAETFDAVLSGYVIAPADVALWTPASTAAPRRAGMIKGGLRADVLTDGEIRVGNRIAAR